MVVIPSNPSRKTTPENAMRTNEENPAFISRIQNKTSKNLQDNTCRSSRSLQATIPCPFSCPDIFRKLHSCVFPYIRDGNTRNEKAARRGNPIRIPAQHNPYFAIILRFFLSMEKLAGDPNITGIFQHINNIYQSNSYK